jgi:hypothetical protein
MLVGIWVNVWVERGQGKSTGNNMDDIWGYPYRLGITIFLVIGTAACTLIFVVFAMWLEKSFKDDKINKR